MGTVAFRFEGGETREVAFTPGRSLMQTAVSNDVRGIEGECGGELTCGTCHVYVESPWRERLPTPRADELDMLEVAENPTEHSRLGCQIQLSDDLHGLVVTVPEPE